LARQIHYFDFSASKSFFSRAKADGLLREFHELTLIYRTENREDNEECFVAFVSFCKSAKSKDLTSAPVKQA
jgi:hypothetical protein